MKLKEKLAEEYYQLRPEGFGNPTDDFLAGFEKAREMASVKARDSQESYHGTEIKTLGEEEGYEL